ncbi:SDR family oxidoreductase [Paenibacillus tengchongensis]|uniref:SDR family oxidoreductase n=1 Tax=Paenibacillus tengchongensis TaxID=2608684 RepID=UPI001FE2B739|nr:SDR family oxidoreductase [Paenibacillus tengchongensis]
MTSDNQPPRAPVALVTGTSSGFGLLVALQLAAQGCRVIAGMRDLTRGAELLKQAEHMNMSGRIHPVIMDVTDEASVIKAVSEAEAAMGGIDILVNNAGFAVGGFTEEISMAEWRRQMDTNFFGVVAVSKAVIPGMRKRREGIIINVSSVSGLTGFPGYGPYAASKFAVEGFSESLRQELAGFGVKVVLVEPGSFRTPIWDKGIAGLQVREDSPYRRELEDVLRYSRRTAMTAPDPSRVAELIGRIVRMRSPKLRYPVGKGTRLLIIGRTLLPWKLLERIIARGLRTGK